MAERHERHPHETKPYLGEYSFWMSTAGVSGGTLVLAIPFFLKVAGYVDWSWTWALAPFWILFGLLTLIAVLGAAAILVYLVFKAVKGTLGRS